MAVAPIRCSDALVAHWLEGGLYLESGGEGLVIDVPNGAAALLASLGALGRVRAVVLTSGRVEAIGGLLALLCAMERHHRGDVPLSVWFGLGEERGASIADAWQRGWPDRYPLVLDAVAPGETVDIAPFTVRMMAVRHGEPRWVEPVGVSPAPGLAVQVGVGSFTLSWVPGAAAGPSVRRACRGADLAVVEVGVSTWPVEATEWRLTPTQALELAAEARQVWLVGDDGAGEILGAEGDN